MNKAIKSDWKTLDMPEKTASFSIDIGLNILKIISCIFTGAGLEFVFIRFSFPRTEE